MVKVLTGVAEFIAMSATMMLESTPPLRNAPRGTSLIIRILISIELVKSAETIRKKTGRQVTYLAYPYGATSSIVTTLLRRLDFRGALTVKRGSNPFFNDNYRVNRSMIYGEYDLARFEKNLRTHSSKALK